MSVVRNRQEILNDLEAAHSRVQQLETELKQYTLDGPVPLPCPKLPPHQNETNLPSGSSFLTRPEDLPLSLREYKRYGRQMMLSNLGLSGQLKLKQSHILVIGAGGLGCPVLLYLAAAGVGEITIFDHDEVELSNLHRQVLHTEKRIGMKKAESAKIGLNQINSDITIHAHTLPFTPSLFSPENEQTPKSLLDAKFSLILDCTDNPATRHFLNSYASAHRIPLVSGGAVRTDGTVGVFGLPLSGQNANEENLFGPCYACVFPQTNSTAVDDLPVNTTKEDSQKAEDVRLEKLTLQGTGACSDEGVLGILCGVVGIQMAAEAVRVILGIAKPTLHLLSPLSAAPLRTVKLRSRKFDCSACGTLGESTPISRWRDFLESTRDGWPGWQDPLCAVPGVGESGARMSDKRQRVKQAATAFASNQQATNSHTAVNIVDVRTAAEFEICHLPGSKNIPFPKLIRNPSSALEGIDTTSENSALTIVCRRGNDSLLAARALKRFLAENGNDSKVEVQDLVGGLTAWSKQVDPNFPVY